MAEGAYIQAARKMAEYNVGILTVNANACHELLEVIEGQEYIIEDAQFALEYARRINDDPELYPILTDSVAHMISAKEAAETIYDKLKCRSIRSEAGQENEPRY